MRLLMVVLSLFLCQLVACAPVSTAPSRSHNSMTGNGNLYTWVDVKLIPYITEQFTTNPMIRGTSFLIVDMSGDNINSDIDLLTADIRDRLRDRLLQERRVKLIWRPAQSLWQHHRSLKQVNCRDIADTAEIYLGIDISSSLARGTYTVRVRAIDRIENRLLPGFGLSWEGQLSPPQLAAFKTTSVDEHLHGLRPSPFASGEADLAAAYLSNNISCVLGQRNDQDNFVVYLDGKVDPSMGGLVFDLMENYLNQFNEIRITTFRANANVFITRKARVVADGLMTFWISTRFVADGEKIRGAETETYFRVEKKKFFVLEPVAQRVYGVLTVEAGNCVGIEDFSGTRSNDRPTVEFRPDGRFFVTTPWGRLVFGSVAQLRDGSSLSLETTSGTTSVRLQRIDEINH